MPFSRKILGFALLAAALPHAAFGQEILARVNDAIVSQYDVNNRLLLLQSSSPAPVPEGRIPYIKRQLLMNLIDENLKNQELARNNVAASEQEVMDAIHNVERQNNMPQDYLLGFLKGKGVDIDDYKKNIATDIGWFKLIGQRYSPTVTISDRDVEAEKKRIEKAMNSRQYLVGELEFPITSDGEATAHKAAEETFRDLREGGDFSAISRQLLQGKTGQPRPPSWYTMDDLEPEKQEALKKMSPGQISAPVRTPLGYYILLVQDVREPRAVSHSLGILNFPREREPAVVKRLKDRPPATCQIMTEAFKTEQDVVPLLLENMQMRNLSAVMQEKVRDLAPNRPSAPFYDEGSDSGHIVMLCEFKAPEKAELPPDDQIRRRLMNIRLERLAARHLRDLKRRAIIEIRGQK